MSYATHPLDGVRHVGIYAAKILNRAKPGELPVELASKFSAPDFRSWHFPDVLTALSDVRFRMRSGKHMLASSFSPFDPNQTSISTFKRDILIPRLVFNRTLEPERWSIRHWRVQPQETLPA
jgi:hypothetical protein